MLLKEYLKEYNSYHILIEDELDILIIYHLLTKRNANIMLKVGWQEKIGDKSSYTRMDRVYVDVLLKPLATYLSHNLKSIRITGQVLRSSYTDLIGKKLGSDVNVNDTIWIITDEDLSTFFNKRRERVGLGILILDITGYLVASISDHIHILLEKYIPYSDLQGSGLSEDIEEIRYLLSKMRREGAYILGGFNTGVKFLVKKFAKYVDKVIYGDFNPDLSGILSLLKSKEIKELPNKYVKIVHLYDEVINKDRFKKVVYGYDEVDKAVRYGMVYEIIVLKSLILKKLDLIELIYNAYKNCINVEIVEIDDSIGRYISSLGGIIGFKY